VLLDRVGDRPVPGPAEKNRSNRKNGSDSQNGSVARIARDEVRLIAVPGDIEGLRRRDPALAVRWRHAVAEALRAALEAGYRIIGIFRYGFYALRTSL
jgi:predicted GNAT superfamily acetyltransferase